MAVATIALVALTAVSVASTAYSVYSSVTAGDEAERQADLAQGIAAKKMRDQKQDEEDRRKRVLASQRAIYGAAGVEMEGSPLLVQADTIRQSEENLRRIRRSGGIEINTAQQFGEAQLNRSRYQAAQSGMQGAQSTYNIGHAYNWW